MHPRDRGRSTLEEAEREPILRALRASNWVMAGPDGAAAKVGMKLRPWPIAYASRKSPADRSESTL